MIAWTITRKYYAFAGQNVAMEECSSQGCGSGLKYFLTDHLGSVVAVVNASGGLVSRQEKNPTRLLATLPKSEDLVRPGVGLIFQDRISACLLDVPRQK